MFAMPAAFRLGNSGLRESKGTPREARPAEAFTTTQKRGDTPSLHVLNLPEPIDGDSGDSFSPNATAWYNVVGNPRYMPQEEIGNGGIQTKRKLGSYDYSFTAPVLSLGGRGVGVNLALTYNSRLWNKESASMEFNYQPRMAGGRLDVRVWQNHRKLRQHGDRRQIGIRPV